MIKLYTDFNMLFIQHGKSVIELNLVVFCHRFLVVSYMLVRLFFLVP